MITRAPVRAAPLFGLVLVGGRSRRMGLNKTELRYHGDVPHARYTANLLEEFCERVFYSCRPDQSEDPVFADKLRIPDVYADAGPLNGILSAQESWPSAAFLVAACDLPHLDRDFLTALVGQRDPAKAATVFENPKRQALEPLCAIYEPGFREAAQFGKRETQGATCPTSLLSGLGPDVKRIRAQDAGVLENANYPEDYERALQVLSAKEKGVPVAGQGKSISVEYFAIFRSCARISSEVVTLENQSLSEIYEDLRRRHGFPLGQESVQVAVNDEFVSWQAPLRSGDRLAFIPPMSGG